MQSRRISISIIIVNYNVYDDVVKCIESIKKNSGKNSYEIIVVDNNSSDRSIDNIEKLYNDIIYMKSERNEGFGTANNKAMHKARGEYLLLTNPDIIFADDSISKMKDFLEQNSNTAVVGPVFMTPEGNVQNYYSFFPNFYSRFLQQIGLYTRTPYMRKRREEFFKESINRNKPFRIDWVLGACMMIRKRTFIETDGFDETFFLYEEEVDWQKRMSESGLNSYMLPEAKVIHNHHSSTSKVGLAFMRYHTFRSMILFTGKHDTGMTGSLNKLLHSVSITHRIIRGIIFKKYRLGNIPNHINLFLDLYRINFSSKKNLYKYKFQSNM